MTQCWLSLSIKLSQDADDPAESRSSIGHCCAPSSGAFATGRRVLLKAMTKRRS
jgi:hypothetical protein